MFAAFKGRCDHCGHDNDEASAPAQPVVTEEMAERALKASYRDMDWEYGTIETVLQACQNHVVRGWMRAALIAALTPPPSRNGG